MNEDQPPQLPQYQPPTGPPVADSKQAGPLTRMIGKMIPNKIKPRMIGRSKGLKADQNVHIKHKKVTFY